MPLEAVTAEMLQQLADMGGPALNEQSPEDARAMYRAMQPAAPEIEVAAVEDRKLPGLDGGPEVPVRIYTPAGSGPFPVLMMFHGGGWVIGDLDTADSQSRDLCQRSGCVLVSVDYRLAPEHRFPGAVDDCYAATCWVAANPAAVGGNGKLAVGGDSAGGNLAAAVALMARDRNGPEIHFQLLVYPCVEARFDTVSYQDNADGYLLTRVGMQWFWDHYCPTTADRNNPYAAPMLADSLAGLPPALVLTAEFDPLRDEGEAYANRLQQAGVEVSCHRHDGLIHGFFAMSRVIPAAVAGMEQAAAALRQHLATGA